jgi:hypothetical protein
MVRPPGTWQAWLQLQACSLALTAHVCCAAADAPHCCCAVYDVTRRETFEDLERIWMKEVDIYSNIEDAVKMVVANKVDLVGGCWAVCVVGWGMVVACTGGQQGGCCGGGWSSGGCNGGAAGAGGQQGVTPSGWQGLLLGLPPLADSRSSLHPFAERKQRARLCAPAASNAHTKAPSCAS